MRIAVWHNLPSGGGKRALYEHVRGLVQRGHLVEAWCPPTADREFLPLAGLCPEHVVPFEWDFSRSRRPWGRFPWSYWKTVGRLRAMDEHCRLCAAQIAKGGFDVLFANSCQFFRTPPIGGMVGDLPCLLYLQEPCRPLYEAMPRLPWAAVAPRASGQPWTRYWTRWLKNAVDVQGLRVQVREEVRNAAAFNRILVNSLFSRESVLRAYGLDSRVCYLGVDTERFRPQALEKQNRVVSVGAGVPEKNMEFLIQSVASIPDPRPSLVWIANVSAGRHLEQMVQLARSLKVDLRVKARVSDEEIVRTLNEAKCMVYAPRLEPFGLAPLEANACGVPVVAVAEGGVRETVENGVNGLLVPPDVRAMGAAIRSVMDDSRLAQRLGEIGRQTVLKRWSLEAAADRLEQHLLETCESH